MIDDRNPIFAAAFRLQEFCQSFLWQFCFIGGVAVQRWGEPRLADLERVLMRQMGRLDRDLIIRELAPLAQLKEEPELVDRLRELMKRWS